MNLRLPDFKNQENRQKLLIGVFVLVILITVLILYSSYFKQQIIPIESPDTSTAGIPAVAMTPGQKLNLDVLDNPIFQSLRKFGTYPVEIKKEEVGRDNPFSPF